LFAAVFDDGHLQRIEILFDSGPFKAAACAVKAEFAAMVIKTACAFWFWYIPYAGRPSQ